MAEHLTAIETAVGIRSDQLDAWRKYTSSLIDLIHMTPPAYNGNDTEKPMLGERMADRAKERADRAKAFKKAAAELRRVLDEKQIERLTTYSHMHSAPMKAPAAKPQPNQMKNPNNKPRLYF